VNTHPLKILLVEDNTPLLAAFQNFLTALGHQVFAAESAEAALEISRGTQVDLLVSDIQLSGISGQELCSKLRCEQPKLRVIFMSGVPSEPNSLADTQYLLKPFKLRDLSEAISKAFSSSDC
jgi:CheY-like chemotaxis protein